MEPVLKLVLFVLIFSSMVVGFFRAYKIYNEKIISASSGWALFGFALLLIIICALIFVSGLYLLLNVFVYLAGQG